VFVHPWSREQKRCKPGKRISYTHHPRCVTWPMGGGFSGYNGRDRHVVVSQMIPEMTKVLGFDRSRGLVFTSAVCSQNRCKVWHKFSKIHQIISYITDTPTIQHGSQRTLCSCIIVPIHFMGNMSLHRIPCQNASVWSGWQDGGPPPPNGLLPKSIDGIQMCGGSCTSADSKEYQLSLSTPSVEDKTCNESWNAPYLLGKCIG